MRSCGHGRTVLGWTMLRQLIIAAVISLANIAVHSIAMAGVIHVFRRREAARNSFGFQVHLILLMIGVVTVLTTAHMIEVAVWAVTYNVLEVVPDGVDPFYFALVNFTTLGYGDVLPVARWQLLGPAATMNGIILLGWSTAVIFAVLSSQTSFSAPTR
jgi:hypothetical protein